MNKRFDYLLIICIQGELVARATDMTGGGVKLDRSIFITYTLRMNNSQFDKT
mgnify:CR=1 FL=1